MNAERRIGPLIFAKENIIEELGLNVAELWDPSILIGKKMKMGTGNYEVVACTFQGFDEEIEGNLPFHREEDEVMEIIIPIAGAAVVETKPDEDSGVLTQTIGLDKKTKSLGDNISRNPSAQYWLETREYGPPSVLVDSGDERAERLVQLTPNFATAVIAIGLIHHAVQIVREDTGRERARWISLKLRKLG
mgnify:CR=1 FL=1